uniref:Uncharacterized protein n=1 Tax=Rhizophora mucronata TaxID=61149 RepID=A0A2P2PUT5_RHIMU
MTIYSLSHQGNYSYIHSSDLQTTITESSLKPEPSTDSHL